MILGLMTAAQHRAAVEEALRVHEANRRVVEGLQNARIGALIRERNDLAEKLARYTGPRERGQGGRFVSTTSAGETADV